MHRLITETIWKDTVPPRRFKPLPGDLEVDVAIIGGGITGLTAAWLLTLRGKKVAVLEAKHVGGGTSGGTTAHATAEYDHDYYVLEGSYGTETAELVCQSLLKAIDAIELIVKDVGIDCDFRRVSGFLYTEKDEDQGKLRREFDAARRAGLDVVMTPNVPLPFEVVLGYEVRNQARFHSMKYLNGLATAIDGEGGKIFDQTRVVGIDDGEPCIVKTEHGTVRAQSVIMATHTPIGLSPLHAVLTPLRSFVIAAKADRLPADALFWDTEDPYNYARLQETSDGPILIVGGKDRKTGQGKEEDSFAALEAYAREHYAITDILYRWSAQFYEPADHLPLIGKNLLAQHVYVGTGYSGDGITCGTLAGMMLTQQVAGESTPYDDLYKPMRLHVAGIRGALSEQLSVAKLFIGDRMRRSETTVFDDLGIGEGRVVKTDGEQIAAFRTESGELRLFSAVCPHMKCIVHWNGAQSSFDCPCHGSRFDTLGRVLDGPALECLAALDVKTARAEKAAGEGFVPPPAP